MAISKERADRFTWKEGDLVFVDEPKKKKPANKKPAPKPDNKKPVKPARGK